MVIGWKARTRDPGVASYRYRVLVPIEGLRRRGHEVEEFESERAYLYDAVIFSKSYAKEEAELAASLRAQGKTIIFDICDNHFYNPDRLPNYEVARVNLLKMIGLCDRIVCSTHALARVVQAEAALDVPPAVVGDVFEHVAVEQEEAPPIAGPYLFWFGQHGSPNAPSGLLDILLVKDRLAEACGRHPFTLVVMSNNRAKFEKELGGMPVPTVYVDWSLAEQHRYLAWARAVIIPLSANPFVACKTHNRLSMALAAGIPVVADQIESYREFAPFAYLDDWATGLEAVLGRPQEARLRASFAHAYCEEHWSSEAVADQWERALGLAPEEPHVVRRPAPEALIALAGAHADAKRFSFANALINAPDLVGDREASDDLLLLRSRVSSGLNRNREAARHLLPIIRRRPIDPKSLSLFAKLLRTIDRPHLIEMIVRRAERQFAKGALDLACLFNVYSATRHFEKALDVAAGDPLPGERAADRGLKVKWIMRSSMSLGRIRQGLEALSRLAKDDKIAANQLASLAPLQTALEAFHAQLGEEPVSPDESDSGGFRVDAVRHMLSLLRREPAEPLAGEGVVIVVSELGIGGTQRQVVNLASALRAQDVGDVRILCGSAPSAESQDHYRPLLEARQIAVVAQGDAAKQAANHSDRWTRLLSRMDRRLADHLRPAEILKAMRAFLALRPRIVHIRQDWETNAFAALLAGVERIFIHIGLTPVDAADLSDAADRLAAEQHNAILQEIGRFPQVEFIVNSEAGAAAYARVLGVDRGRCHCVLNGFESDNFSPASALVRAQVRQTLGFTADDVVIGSVIRFSPQKHPNRLIRIVRAARRRDSRIRLLLVGGGTMEDEILHSLTKAGLQDAVVFGTALEALPSLYAAMDVFVLASRREGMPNVVLEAQKMGIPIIASDVSGTREAIIEGVTGYVVPPDDIDAYVDHIVAIASAPEFRERSRAVGPGHIDGLFDVDRLGRDVARHFSRV